MRPSGQIVLQETIRRLPVVIPASVLTASDPLLRSVDATTDIVKATGNNVRVRCILCDGKGGILPGAILRISAQAKVTGGVEACTFTTGTPLVLGDYSNDATNDNIGGSIDVKSDTVTAEVNVVIPFAANGAKPITLKHMWCEINAAITI